MAENGVSNNDVPMIPGWQARIEAAQKVTHYTTLDGRVLARIRYGDEPGIGDIADKPCYDCGALKGQYHVGPVCGLERCPNCGGQLSSCDCDFVGDTPSEEEFGTPADYLRVFEALQTEGIPEKHLALLRAHLAAPGQTTTWAKLAAAVGYPNGSSVNLQYGKFAERVARQLGLSDKPLDPNGTAWWLWVLVRWADERDHESGHTAFVLRSPVIEAIQGLAISPATAPGQQL